MRDDTLHAADVVALLTVLDVYKPVPLFIRVRNGGPAEPCYGMAIEVTPEGYRVVMLGAMENL